MVDESGWKQVHGDVFRAPKFLLLYSALIGPRTLLLLTRFALFIFFVFFHLGTGYQLIALTFCVISLTLIGSFYDEFSAPLLHPLKY